MSVFSHPDFDSHEGVHFFEDAALGLKAIIAIHSTVRGNSAGGTRFWSYPSDSQALTDVLRLSRAMSYKNAMADLPLGGGKAVILKPSQSIDRQKFFAAYGRFIEQIGGCYITAEDVGMTPQDMDVIATQTNYVAGRSRGKAASGDPSPLTALGILYGLQVAAQYRLGCSDLSGVKVAIQGVGHVGSHLCRLLHQAGAQLWVSDVDPTRVAAMVDQYDAIGVDVHQIHAQDVDIFSPCALGGTINMTTATEIKAKIIGGGANNQLYDVDIAQLLVQRQILYCPDYVINSGGIINVAAEVSGHYDRQWVETKLQRLGQTLADIFVCAVQQNQSTHMIANAMARARLCPP